MLNGENYMAKRKKMKKKYGSGNLLSWGQLKWKNTNFVNIQQSPCCIVIYTFFAHDVLKRRFTTPRLKAFSSKRILYLASILLFPFLFASFLQKKVSFLQQYLIYNRVMIKGDILKNYFIIKWSYQNVGLVQSWGYVLDC